MSCCNDGIDERYFGLKIDRNPLTARECENENINLCIDREYNFGVIIEGDHQAQTFSEDLLQAWVITQPDNGRDLEVDFIDFNNANYDGSVLFNDRQTGDGFPPRRGSAVDGDYNLYVITDDLPKLHRYTFDPLAKDYEVSVGTTFELEGLAYVHHRDEVWIRSRDQNGFLFVRNPADGSAIKTISDIGSNQEGGLLYSHVTKKLYWGRLDNANEQFDIIEFDPDTETQTEHTDLLPVTTNMDSGNSINSYTIDFEGNHLFVYVTDSTTNPDSVSLVKYDKDFNFLFSKDITQWAGIGDLQSVLIAVDPERDIYTTEDRGSEVYMNRFTTDENGLNPTHAWRRLIVSSNTLSPGFVDIQAERDPNGRILSIHSRAGGVQATKKDGTGDKMVFNAGFGSNIIVLPGEVFAVQ